MYILETTAQDRSFENGWRKPAQFARNTIASIVPARSDDRSGEVTGAYEAKNS